MVGLLRADHVTTVDIVVRFLDVSKIFRYLDQSNETRADDDDVFKRFWLKWRLNRSNTVAYGENIIKRFALIDGAVMIWIRCKTVCNLITITITSNKFEPRIKG